MKYWSVNINGKCLTVNSTHIIYGAIFAGVIFFGSAFSLFQIVNSNLNTGKFLKRKKQQEILMSSLKTIENQFSALHKSIDSLVDWDKKIRLVWGIPEVDEDIRKLGVGGKELFGSGDIVDRLASSTERLDKKLDLESESCSEIAKRITQVKNLLSATPSVWPICGTLTSGFGWRYFGGGKEFHAAIDIANNIGTPVHVTADGTVIGAGYEGGLGLLITVDHGYGYVTRYGHLSRATVNTGQKVGRGDIIGYVGNSGRSTGPHLHYEVMVGSDSKVNPLGYIIPGNTTY